MRNKTLCDAVTYLVSFRGMPERKVVRNGVTREEIRLILNGSYGRISKETIIKVKENLNLTDEEILHNALMYRAQMACNSVFTLLTDSERTDEDAKEMAEFMKDYIDEMMRLRTTRL